MLNDGGDLTGRIMDKVFEEVYPTATRVGVVGFVSLHYSVIYKIKKNFKGSNPVGE
jgi:hypothetical protein